MAEVVFKKVTKIFPGGVRAVDEFELTVPDKEFLVLVGPSGCGKSTTLRMVAGLEEITSGEIYIDNRLVNDVAPKDRDIAMVFQNYALYPHMTVYKNMAFGLKLRGYKRDEIERRVNEAATILDIKNLLHRKPKELSGGQRQRVAVGRAIVRKPKVFLFDEPLSNLDAKLRVQMRAEISRLHNRLQATMIYVTHDQLEAMTMGDRIVVMKDGKIHQAAAPIALYDRPANKFVAGFIGSPPMNFIDGTVSIDNGVYYFSDGVFRIKLDERFEQALNGRTGQFTFGIRPEDIDDRANHPNADPERVVTCRVEVVEPLGAEAIWYLATSRSVFVARVDAHAVAAVNNNKDMVFSVDKAHLFEPGEDGRLLV